MLKDRTCLILTTQSAQIYSPAAGMRPAGESGDSSSPLSRSRLFALSNHGPGQLAAPHRPVKEGAAPLPRHSPPATGIPPAGVGRHPSPPLWVPFCQRPRNSSHCSDQLPASRVWATAQAAAPMNTLPRALDPASNQATCFCWRSEGASEKDLS
jgi:hypothetical protein